MLNLICLIQEMCKVLVFIGDKRTCRHCWLPPKGSASYVLCTQTGERTRFCHLTQQLKTHISKNAETLDVKCDFLLYLGLLFIYLALLWKKRFRSSSSWCSSRLIWGNCTSWVSPERRGTRHDKWLWRFGPLLIKLALMGLAFVPLLIPASPCKSHQGTYEEMW